LKEDKLTLDTTDKILDFAIGKEEAAAEFYQGLADKMSRPDMKKVFVDFAAEELGHKAKLQAIKAGKKLVLSEKKIVDLKIGDTLVEQEPKADIGYQEALIIAMKAEKAAFIMYSNLANATDEAGLTDLFMSLAQEEAKHKLRFEVEYDDHVFEEN
jgi:rubrerythrin